MTVKPPGTTVKNPGTTRKTLYQAIGQILRDVADWDGHRGNKKVGYHIFQWTEVNFSVFQTFIA